MCIISYMHVSFGMRVYLTVIEVCLHKMHRCLAL